MEYKIKIYLKSAEQGVYPLPGTYSIWETEYQRLMADWANAANQSPTAAGKFYQCMLEDEQKQTRDVYLLLRFSDVAAIA